MIDIDKSIKVARAWLRDALSEQNENFSNNLIDVNFIAIHHSSVNDAHLAKLTAEATVKIIGRYASTIRDYKFKTKGTFVGLDLVGFDAKFIEQVLRTPRIGFVKVESPGPIRIRRTWCQVEDIPFHSIDDYFLLYGPTSVGLDMKALEHD